MTTLEYTEPNIPKAEQELKFLFGFGQFSAAEPSEEQRLLPELKPICLSIRHTCESC